MIIDTFDKGELEREVTVEGTVANQPWRWTSVKVPKKFPKIMPAKWVAKNYKGSWARGIDYWFFLDKEDAERFTKKWMKA